MRPEHNLVTHLLDDYRFIYTVPTGPHFFEIEKDKMLFYCIPEVNLKPMRFGQYAVCRPRSVSRSRWMSHHRASCIATAKG